MNNKPIIIDGVDVAECEFFGTSFNFDCIAYCINCKDKSNCYYKQLQQLKEKYKHLDDEYFNGLEIKTIVELAKKSIRITSENIKLEKENEQLMEDLTTLQQTYEACEKEYKSLNAKYIKVLELSKKGVDSYEYCLRELEEENQKIKVKIKEISEKLDDALDIEKTEDAEESFDLIHEISADLEKLISTSNDVGEKGT